MSINKQGCLSSFYVQMYDSGIYIYIHQVHTYVEFIRYTCSSELKSKKSSVYWFVSPFILARCVTGTFGIAQMRKRGRTYRPSVDCSTATAKRVAYYTRLKVHHDRYLLGLLQYCELNGKVTQFRSLSRNSQWARAGSARSNPCRLRKDRCHKRSPSTHLSKR